MKISVLQPDIAWENKSLNFHILTELLVPLNGNTDLVILPEMFNTGFSMDPNKLAETSDGETFQWLKNVSGKGNFGICGSYIVKENNKFFNRWVFYSAETQLCKYDKRHLFKMGGENNLFSPGRSRLAFSFRGIRISAYICYDLRFPVWSRNTEKSDLLIFSANWPASRQKVWNTLLCARAIENQCYVAGSNRTGTDGEGIQYMGESMIIDPRGEIISNAGSLQNCHVSAEISLAELNKFRHSFPVTDDADGFTIKF
jgi:omega-amidase